MRWQDGEGNSQLLYGQEELADVWFEDNMWYATTVVPDKSYELSSIEEAKVWCERVLMGYHEDMAYHLKSLLAARECDL